MRRPWPTLDCYAKEEEEEEEEEVYYCQIIKKASTPPSWSRTKHVLSKCRHSRHDRTTVSRKTKWTRNACIRTSDITTVLACAFYILSDF
jgi:hypothetical protein